MQLDDIFEMCDKTMMESVMKKIIEVIDPFPSPF